MWNVMMVVVWYWFTDGLCRDTLIASRCIEGQIRAKVRTYQSRVSAHYGQRNFNVDRVFPAGHTPLFPVQQCVLQGKLR